MLDHLAPTDWLLAGAAVFALAALLLFAAARLPQRRAQRRLSRLLAPPPPPAPLGPVRGWPARLAQQLTGHLDTALGRALIAEEDKQLLDRAGFDHQQGRALYMGLRLALALLGALLWLALRPAHGMVAAWALGLAVFGGLMLPKWLLRVRAGQRLAAVKQELPLLVDLLRLLQGSGMSLDQSLHVAATDFREALPVLAGELEVAERQYRAGIGRADSFRRLTRLYEGDALSELVALLVQLDRHGGAVDEPLRRFGAALREQRRGELRATVGKRNVKMTLVMVMTLLPALIVVIGGPAFLAISRALGRGT